MVGSTEIPHLLRVARGETLDRPPVWMMRQAGRYMKVYRDLRDKYPSFRERSENPDLAIEISLQPWYAFQPDGVIMFSDILTPLPGIGIPFDIIESKGQLSIRLFAPKNRSINFIPSTPKNLFPSLKLSSKRYALKWAINRLYWVLSAHLGR